MSRNWHAALTYLLADATLPRYRNRRTWSRSFDLSDVEHESDGVPVEVDREYAERCRRTRAYRSAP